MQFSDPKTVERKIGLALSGGGSRAIAFHLGCLRALHKLGILEDVLAVSCVSGGSVIGAALVAHEGDFESFETRMRVVLSNGFARAMIFRMISLTGAKIVLAFTLSALAAFLIFLIRTFGAIVCLVPCSRKIGASLSGVHSPFRRFASRTTLLELVLDETLFGGRRLTQLPSHPNLIVNATELRTGSSFKFGARESGSWRTGRVKDNSISLAHAVTASAAYPLFLPAFDETLEFSRAGRDELRRVILTDGGVYDNLGVSNFWPDRSADISFNVDRFDTIICCSAGYGLRHDPPSQFLAARLMSAFTTTFDRAQNASFQRLHDLRESGKIRGFALPYLGQQDGKLPNPPVDLVKREDAHAYPTDFNAMPEEWIDRLSLRGEQVTTCLVRAYLPELINQSLRTSNHENLHA